VPRVRAAVISTFVLLVIAVALAVVWFLLGASVHARQHRDDAQNEALAAARQAAVNFNSYDYRTLDKQLSVVAGELTGSIKTDFDAQRANITSTFTTSKAVSLAQVIDAAPLEVGTACPRTTTRSCALVALEVGFTPGGGSTTAQTDLLELQLQKEGGRWLVSNIQTEE